MKRKMLLIMAVVMVLTMAGCAPQGGMVTEPGKAPDAGAEAEPKEAEPVEETTETEDKKTEEKSIETDKSVEEEEDNKVDDSFWQDEFCRLVTDGAKAGDESGPLCYYYVYDIDKDGIPELLLQYGDCEAAYHGPVYKYDTEKKAVAEVGDIGMGHTIFYTYPDGPGMIHDIAHMGYQSISKLTIDQGSINEEELFTEELDMEKDEWYTEVDEIIKGAVEIPAYDPGYLTGILGAGSKAPSNASGEDDPNNGSISSEMEKVLQTYDDYMKSVFDSAYGDVKISLLYINDDDIPEAVIEQDGDIGWNIVGYDNGKVVDMSAVVCDSLYYVPKGNCYYYEWSDGESTGFVCYTTEGTKVSEWSIDDAYTTQGAEHYYSDQNTTRQKISDEEVQALRNKVEKGSVRFDGSFYPTAEEAYGLLNNDTVDANDEAGLEKQLGIKSISATSELKVQSVDGMTYYAEHLSDGNYSTPWVEGVDGVGKGEKITIKLDSPHEITFVGIYNGILKTKKRCMINGQVKKVEIDWGNGDKQTADVKMMDFPETDDAILISELDPTFVRPEKPCTTDTITITILDAAPGSKYEDTGISEIEVWGK